MMIFPLSARASFLLIAAASFLLNASSWALLYFKVPGGSFPFILHYNIYFGRDLLGARIELFQIPFAGFVIFACNAILGYILFAKDKKLAWVVMGATFAIELIVLYASYIIASINS